jgi:uncharacterized protein YciI
MYYLLFYEKTKDYAKLQLPYAEAHRKHVMQAASAGTLVLAGNLNDESANVSVSGSAEGAALLLFESDDATIAEEFAKEDPYVVNGIITRWYVRAWDAVIDKYADLRIRS